MATQAYPFEKLNLKIGLKTWTDRKEISTKHFAEDMKYTYSHAWNILNGSAPVTYEVVGRFVEAYGDQAAGELLELSGRPNGEPEPEAQGQS